MTLREFHKKHARSIPIVFFCLGFVFDTLMLTRIDELKVILQQAVYLLVSGALIGFELVEISRELHPPRWLAKAWEYHEELLHFLLGTLLNSYTIFYFKSASTITSFLFIILLVTLLILNEFKHFGKSQAQVHMAFWSLCLVSYFASLAPITIGSIGALPFLAGMGAAIAVFYLFFRVMARILLSSNSGGSLLRTHLLHPFLGIIALFTLLYFAQAIPPVPLSVSYLGIFHDVAKENGSYRLSYTRPSWKFWEHGDQTFLARPGDSIFCFARVFSPTRFSGELKVQWLYHDANRGWLPSDSLPMAITGGREEGFRGVTKKANFQPGKWQVRIETLDNRELGRIGFEILRDEETGPRVEKTMVQ